MKHLLSLIAAAGLLGGNLPRAHAETALSVDFFYDALEPDGEWMEVADYGYCWHPREVTEQWRPYTQGTWAYTDAGWTWISDEPHGWATYHYGRWVNVDATGWVWVPDTEWGPAWVSWRRSDTYVGWAPLPPEASFQRTVGLSNWVDSYYDIGPASYSFVEIRNLGAPRLATVILEPHRNITIINETRNITKITYVNNVIVNEGPEYEVVSRVSAQPIRRLRLERRVDLGADVRTVRSEQFRPTVEGDALRVVAPMLQPGSGAAPKRIARKLANVQINHGWKNAGPPEQVEKLRMKVKAEAKPPAELPPQPKFETAQQRAGRDRQTVAAGEPKPAAEPGAAPAADPSAPPATASKPPMKGREKTPGVAGRTSVAPPGADAATADPATTAPPKAAATSPDPNAPAGTASRPPMKGREKTPGVAGRAGVAQPGADATTADPTDPVKPGADRPGKPGKERAGKGEPSAQPARGKNAPAPAATPPAEAASEPAAPDAANVPAATRGKANPGPAKRGARTAPDAPSEPSSAPPTAPPPGDTDQPGKGRGKNDQPKPARTQRDAAPGPGGPPAPDASADRPKAGAAGPTGPGASRAGAGARGAEPGKKRTPKEPAEAPGEPAPERP